MLRFKKLISRSKNTPGENPKLKLKKESSSSVQITALEEPAISTASASSTPTAAIPQTQSRFAPAPAPAPLTALPPLRLYDQNGQKLHFWQADPGWWRDWIVRVSLPMLSGGAAYGVYQYNAEMKYIPEPVAMFIAGAFETCYIGLAVSRNLTGERKKKAVRIAAGAVAVSMMYNIIGGLFHRLPLALQAYTDNSWGRLGLEGALAIIHGAPLALLSYSVAHLIFEIMTEDRYSYGWSEEEGTTTPQTDQAQAQTATASGSEQAEVLKKLAVQLSQLNSLITGVAQIQQNLRDDFEAMLADNETRFLRLEERFHFPQAHPQAKEDEEFKLLRLPVEFAPANFGHGQGAADGGGYLDEDIFNLEVQAQPQKMGATTALLDSIEPGPAPWEEAQAQTTRGYGAELERFLKATKLNRAEARKLLEKYGVKSAGEAYKGLRMLGKLPAGMSQAEFEPLYIELTKDEAQKSLENLDQQCYQMRVEQKLSFEKIGKQVGLSENTAKKYAERWARNNSLPSPK